MYLLPLQISTKNLLVSLLEETTNFMDFIVYYFEENATVLCIANTEQSLQI